MHNPVQAVPVILMNRFFRVFLPFAAGYFLSYLFRNVNAVIASELESDVGMSADQLGLMTGLYFLAFACFQLPLGVLLDRFGPRRVEAFLLLIAGAGSLIFAVGQQLATLGVGRALIGLGVSACLMASFKAFSLWFDPQRLPLVNGFLLACGGLGAMSATAPVEAILGMTTWRVLFVGLAMACVVAAAVLWCVVPEKTNMARVEPLSQQVAALNRILRSSVFWRFAPAAMVFPGATMAVQGLWAGPWLRDVAGLDRNEVAHHLLLLALATTVGFVAWGALAERMARLGIGSMKVAGTGLVLFMLSVMVLAWQPTSNVLLFWLMFGLCGSSGTLLYAVITPRFDASLMGRVITAFNLMVFLGAFSLQWGIGVAIGFWSGGSGTAYTAEGYRACFSLVAALQATALIWLLRSRE
ncbi:membrane protein [Litchfieldella qijiaojingensis]|uniref:Membrane protein n=1 Tax=Litchfieldella qijiaojingensis TaxID=980347 RepID=A0ABQ2YXE4_9GAMM|nr:MFS transporter [Halomonas qijiaojingensis]GGX98517.1 membrane protein [Halomonas qijiaojingensis]